MKIGFESVVEATGGTVEGGLAEDIVFQSVTTDTRALEPGSLFVALRGPRYDGHDYLDEAVCRGASGVVVDHGKVPSGVVGIRVKDTLISLGRLARFCRRTQGLKVLAITGSVGKTTTKEI